MELRRQTLRGATETGYQPGGATATLTVLECGHSTVDWPIAGAGAGRYTGLKAKRWWCPECRHTRRAAGLSSGSPKP